MMSVEQIRVSRQAREMEDLMLSVIVNVVNDNDGGGGGQYVDLLLFVKIRIFDFDVGLEIRILTPSRVETIGKRSILRLETATNR